MCGGTFCFVSCYVCVWLLSCGVVLFWFGLLYCVWMYSSLCVLLCCLCCCVCYDLVWIGFVACVASFCVVVCALLRSMMRCVVV